MGLSSGHRHGASVPLVLVVVSCLHLGRVDSLYHTSSEILHWFSHSAAKHPSVLRFRELRDRHSRSYLPIATITAGLNGQQLRDQSKPVVLFVFGEHAREVITSEVAVWLARMLVDNSSAIYTWPELGQAMERAQDPDSSSSSSGVGSSSSSTSSAIQSSSSSSSSSVADWARQIRSIVSEVLQKLEVQIIPIEALDSRRQFEEGDLCARKTSSNVDLNRNWPFAWHKEDPADEQYGGPGPLSEPQSRLVKQLIDSHGNRLLGYVNVHSGEWALYTPWDSKPAYAPDLPADMPKLVSQIGRLCNCKAGPAGAVSGYLAFGSSMDYVYVHKKVPYPLTVEVYGGGDIGKLQPGESNKPLTEFPVQEKPAGSPPLHKRSLLQQQQWSEQDGLQQQCLRQEQQQQQQQQGWSDRSWMQVCKRLLLRGQQQQGLADGDWGVGIRGDRTERQQQQNVGGYSLHAGSSIDVGESAAAQSAAAAGSARISIQQQLYLRRRGLLQLTELQQQQQGNSLPQQQQQQQIAQDGILDVVTAAAANKQVCFDAFNPRSEDVYRRVVADWVAAFVLMLKHMADSEVYKAMASAAVNSSSSLIG